MNYYKRILSFSLNNPIRVIGNLKRLQSKTISTKKHIFVLGAPRSGTTLLQSILKVHPNIGGIDGETGFFTYRNIFSESYPGISSYEYRKILLSTYDIVSSFDNYANLITRKQNTKNIIEKTPQHIMRLSFLLNHFPESKFIHIYRDGRDCYCSAQNHPNVPQRRNVQVYAKYWKKCIEKRKAMGFQRNLLDVKYESFTDNPQAEILRIMDFLEECFLQELLDHNLYSKTKLSKFLPFTKLGKPIDRKSQKRWKKEMSYDQIKTFNKIAGNQLKYLGYGP